MANERYHVPGLVRALEVVEALSVCAREGATLTELTGVLGYPKNSIFRITTTLMDKGYIVRDTETQKFRLTRKFLSYGLSSVTEENIIEQSIDVMRDLSDETGASAFLGVLHEGSGMIIEQAPAGYPFKLSVDLGTKFNLHSGAPGKTLMAYLPDEERAAMLETLSFKKYTETTITNAADMEVELAWVRDMGYSQDLAEEFEAIHCMGAPIFDYTNRVVASIWVSAASVILPTERFSECGAMVKAAGLKISARLGYLND